MIRQCTNADQRIWFCTWCCEMIPRERIKTGEKHEKLPILPTFAIWNKSKSDQLSQVPPTAVPNRPTSPTEPKPNAAGIFDGVPGAGN